MLLAIIQLSQPVVLREGGEAKPGRRLLYGKWLLVGLERWLRRERRWKAVNEEALFD